MHLIKIKVATDIGVYGQRFKRQQRHTRQVVKCDIILHTNVLLQLYVVHEYKYNN